MSRTHIGIGIKMNYCKVFILVEMSPDSTQTYHMVTTKCYTKLFLFNILKNCLMDRFNDFNPIVFKNRLGCMNAYLSYITVCIYIIKTQRARCLYNSIRPQ